MSNFKELLSLTQNSKEYNGLYQMILMAITLRQQKIMKEKEEK